MLRISDTGSTERKWAETFVGNRRTQSRLSFSSRA